MKAIRIKSRMYDKLSIGNFILAIQAIINALTGNPNFLTPTPGILDLQSALDTFKNLAAGVKAGNLTLKDDRDLSREHVALLIVELAAYCLDTSIQSSDSMEQAVSKIQSANLHVQQPGENVGPLHAPGNLRSKALSNAIQLEFDRVKGANSYFIWWAVGFPSEELVWNEIVTTRTKVTIPNCAPGQVMTFKVYALGAAGLGQPSDFITDMAKL